MHEDEDLRRKQFDDLLENLDSECVAVGVLGASGNFLVGQVIISIIL